MDWLGAVLIVTGLILFTFSVINSSHAPQQWQTPYIYILFTVGSLLLMAGAYVEARVAEQPRKSLIHIYLNVLKPPTMSKLKLVPS